MVERSRPLSFLCMMCTVALGLTIVATAAHLPGWVRSHFADVLVCIAIYFAGAFVLPAISAYRLAFATFAFATVVELTQLYHTPALDRFRATLLGQLTIGSTYGTLDLVCYAIGTIVAMLFDICVVLRCHRVKTND